MKHQKITKIRKIVENVTDKEFLSNIKAKSSLDLLTDLMFCSYKA